MSLEKARWYTPGTTSKADTLSVLNTINPLSALSPSNTKDYVPFWLVKAFKGNDKWNFKDKNAVKTAHLVSKIALGGAAFGIGALALRSLMYGTDKDTFQVNKTPTQKLDKIYLRPTEALIQPEEQQKVVKKAKAYSIAIGGLPLLAAIFAAGIGAKKADRIYDDVKLKNLQQQQKQLLAQKQRIALQRIKGARGIKDPAQLNTMQKSEGFRKQAAGQILFAGAGALGLILFLLGRQAGKALHDANNEDTIKFKAYKKGLQQYNKARAFEQNIDTQPLDPKMVQLLNSNLNKKTSTNIDQKPLSQITI